MNSQRYNAGVVGLGSMGMGMAKSCLRAGISTWGFDINRKQLDEFASHGGTVAELDASIGELDAIALVVVNGAQVRSILFDEPALTDRIRPGTVVLGCTTQSPDDARGLAAQLSERDIHYLDAPISGGSVKAAQGALTIMASGSPDAFSSARALLDATADKVIELGNEPGVASAMKMVNQLLAGIHIASTAEAFSFGLKHGLDADTIFETISECAGNSWMFGNRGPHIVAGDYTPHSSVDIFVKDLGIVSDMARGNQCYTPLASAALQEFIAASASGLGALDDSAVAKVYARNTGVKLPGDEG